MLWAVCAEIHINTDFVKKSTQDNFYTTYLTHMKTEIFISQFIDSLFIETFTLSPPLPFA